MSTFADLADLLLEAMGEQVALDRMVASETSETKIPDWPGGVSGTVWQLNPEWLQRVDALRRKALGLWRDLDSRWGGRLVTADHAIWIDIGRKLGTEGDYWADFHNVGFAEENELRRLETVYGKTNAERTGSENDKDDRADNEPPLDAEEVNILRALQKSAPLMLKQVELEDRTGISRKTVGGRLDSLIRLGLVRQPKGPKKGFAITDKGSRALAAIGA